MKRSIFLLGLIVFAIAAVLSAGFHASAPVSAADSVKVTFWNYWNGTNGEVIQALIERYNAEHPDAQIENVSIAWEELRFKLQLAVATGELPDMAAGDMAWMPFLAASGKPVPLNSYIEAAGLDLNDIFPALLNIDRYGDQYLGLPVSTNNLELFINDDLFKAAGLDPATPPKTWDELLQMASTCADPDKGVIGMELYPVPGNEGMTWQFQVYLWQAGGEFLNADNTAAAFNSEAGRRALQFWIDLIDSGAYTISDWGSFEQGQACMRMDGTWMVGIFAQNAPFKFSVAKMPYPADGEPATNMGGEHVVIFTQDEAKQKAAWDFLAWFVGPEAQIAWDEGTGFMPIRNAVATNEDYLTWVNGNEPRLIPFIDMQQYAHNRPSIELYPEISDVFSAMVERALYKEMSVEEALTAAEVGVNGLLR
jgi:multiple sugar transport system substrate-binding protein